MVQATRSTRQITSFYKTAYDNYINAMNTFQGQTEKMVRLFLDQSPWLPEESRNAVNTWVKVYGKGCDDFTAAADEQLKKFEAMFNPGEKVDPMNNVN